MAEQIHQLYCTHCTLGTSYSHQRTDESRSQVFEYAVRAGSFPRESALEYYRSLEPFLYYRQKIGTPDSELLRRTAQTSEPRLVYVAQHRGQKFVALTSYRSQDTRGRPGSYFSHILIADRAPGPDSAWGAAEALQLWDAPSWQREDAGIEFQLPSLDRLPLPAVPAICDALVLEFLTVPADGDFHDPHQIIPPRWQSYSPARRQTLLADVLQGYLELDLNRGQVLLIAVEPALAALVFYGVARLLPRRAADKFSCSTFEGSQSISLVNTALSATWFENPEAGPGSVELPREAYNRRGFALNTVIDDSAQLPWKSRSPAPRFGETLVDTLAREGWEATRHMVEACDAAELSHAVELEQTLQARDWARRLLDPALEVIPHPHWPAAVETVCRRLVRERLTDCEPALRRQLSEGSWTRLGLILQELAADSAAEGVLSGLVQAIPSSRYADLLPSPLPAPLKVKLLQNYVEQARSLPPGCEALWPASRAYPGMPDLLRTLLKTLPSARARELVVDFVKTQSNGNPNVLGSLLDVLPTGPLGPTLVGELIPQSVVSDRVVLELLKTPEHRRRLLLEGSALPPARERLTQILERRLFDIHRDPAQFDLTLQLLGDDVQRAGLLADHKSSLFAWRSFREALAQFRAVPEQPVSRWNRRQHEADANKCAEEVARTAKHALVASRPVPREPEAQWAIIESLILGLPPEQAVSKALVTSIQKYLTNPVWVNAPLYERGEGVTLQRLRSRLPSGRVLAGVVVAAAVVGFIVWPKSSISRHPSKSKATQQRVTKTSAPATRVDRLPNEWIHDIKRKDRQVKDFAIAIALKAIPDDAFKDELLPKSIEDAATAGVGDEDSLFADMAPREAGAQGVLHVAEQHLLSDNTVSQVLNKFAGDRFVNLRDDDLAKKYVRDLLKATASELKVRSGDRLKELYTAAIRRRFHRMRDRELAKRTVRPWDHCGEQPFSASFKGKISKVQAHFPPGSKINGRRDEDSLVIQADKDGKHVSLATLKWKGKELSLQRDNSAVSDPDWLEVLQSLIEVESDALGFEFITPHAIEETPLLAINPSAREFVLELTLPLFLRHECKIEDFTLKLSKEPRAESTKPEVMSMAARVVVFEKLLEKANSVAVAVEILAPTEMSTPLLRATVRNPKPLKPDDRTFVVAALKWLEVVLDVDKVKTGEHIAPNADGFVGRVKVLLTDKEQLATIGRLAGPFRWKYTTVPGDQREILTKLKDVLTAKRTDPFLDRIYDEGLLFCGGIGHVVIDAENQRPIFVPAIQSPRMPADKMP